MKGTKLGKLIKENKKLKRHNRVLSRRCSRYWKALYFYAHPDTYFATSLMCDPPCGEISEDYDDSGDYYGECLGKRARKALNKKFVWAKEN